MNLTGQIERLREEFPTQSPNPEALKRLSDFYEDMKEKGVAKSPTYDLPHPDTIGRNLVWHQVTGKRQMP